MPPVGEPEIKQPRIYYGEQSNGYAIVGSKQREIDFQSPTAAPRRASYAGKGGVPMNSLVRRFAFALRFGDINPLISNLVTPSSRAMYVRDIGERVRKAAPFLRYDSDPYPVVLNGRIVWVQDAYTTTSRYPYAQRADTEQVPAGSGLNSRFNYVRNSVKVTIDAYDGTMKFYVFDDSDPIVRAYQKAFPSLFTPKSAMSTELKQPPALPGGPLPGADEHVRPLPHHRSRPTSTTPRTRGRSPRTRARVPIGERRRGRRGDRDVSGAARRARWPSPRASAAWTRPTCCCGCPRRSARASSSCARSCPCRQGDRQQNLSAFMTAKSDPDDYGKLQVFVMPRGGQIDGPALVNSRILSTAEITQRAHPAQPRGLAGAAGQRARDPDRELAALHPAALRARRTWPTRCPSCARSSSCSASGRSWATPCRRRCSSCSATRRRRSSSSPARRRRRRAAGAGRPDVQRAAPAGGRRVQGGRRRPARPATSPATRPRSSRPRQLVEQAAQASGQTAVDDHDDTSGRLGLSGRCQAERRSDSSRTCSAKCSRRCASGDGSCRPASSISARRATVTRVSSAATLAECMRTSSRSSWVGALAASSTRSVDAPLEPHHAVVELLGVHGDGDQRPLDPRRDHESGRRLIVPARPAAVA